MEMISGMPVALGCGVSKLAQRVDAQLNGAAIQEAAEATDTLQPDATVDQGEGHAYLDDTVVTFTPQSVFCGICKGSANLTSEGTVKAEKCLVSGSCEVEWVERYPDRYRGKDGKLAADHLPCGAEIGCSALLRLVDVGEGKTQVELIRGRCEIVARGKNWLAAGIKAAANAALHPPEKFEEFDGLGSGREGG